MAGLDMIHVPYRGAAPASERSYSRTCPSPVTGGATLDNAKSGQVQVLGYTGAQRAAIAPEIPTVAEDGIPGFNVVSWYGFFVPSKTPMKSSRK